MNGLKTQHPRISFFSPISSVLCLVTQTVQIYKLNLKKAEEPEIKLPTSLGSQKKGIPKTIYFCITDKAKAFDYVDHNKPRKIHQEMGIPDNLTFLLRNL